MPSKRLHGLGTLKVLTSILDVAIESKVMALILVAPVSCLDLVYSSAKLSTMSHEPHEVFLSEAEGR